MSRRKRLPGRLSAVQVLARGEGQSSDLVCQPPGRGSIHDPDRHQTGRQMRKCLLPYLLLRILWNATLLEKTHPTRGRDWCSPVNQIHVLLSGRHGPVVLSRGIFPPPASSIASCPLASFQASPESAGQGLLRASPRQDPTGSQHVLTSPLLLEPFPRGTGHPLQPRGESSPCHVSQ